MGFSANGPDTKHFKVELSEADATTIANGLANFFYHEPSKITRWLLTENLSFGGIAPIALIMVGRGHKVAQFIKDATEGNLP